MLYIVSLSYRKFKFTDGCAALAFAEVAKRTSQDDDLEVYMSLEKLHDEAIPGGDEK